MVKLVLIAELVIEVEKWVLVIIFVDGPGVIDWFDDFIVPYIFIVNLGSFYPPVITLYTALYMLLQLPMLRELVGLY